MPTNKSLLRKKRYAFLKDAIDTKGRLPFYKEYQKYAKIMMFIYESLRDMAENEGLQNNEGILFRMRFLESGFRGGKGITTVNLKILLEHAIRPGSCRMKSFEIEHTNKTEVLCALETFANYYGLTFGQEEKYTRLDSEKLYIISLPKEA